MNGVDLVEIHKVSFKQNTSPTQGTNKEMVDGSAVSEVKFYSVYQEYKQIQT